MTTDDRLTRHQLSDLAQDRPGWCVSLFLPTHRAGPDVQQDSIRLKNLLRDAERRLTDLGMRGPDVQHVLEPISRLQADVLFWRHQADGLALFAAADFFRVYRVPQRLPDLVVVTDRFHLKPLLPLLTADGRFYLLALSQKQIRVFEGARDQMRELPVDGMPTSLADALRMDDPEQQIQFHTGAPVAGHRRAAMFHGQGGGSDDAKASLLQFFGRVDAGLRAVLQDESAPLVLAGVAYLLPIYREASAYPHLVGDGVIGNPQALSADELHAQAWRIVRPLFRRAQDQAAAMLQSLAGTGRVSTDIGETAAAAHQGRVEAVFMPAGVQRWGSFDEDTQQVDLHAEAHPGDEDLLDFIAIHTILNRGAAYVVERASMPADTPVAAVFRF